jgi:hypothetical protein
LFTPSSHLWMSSREGTRPMMQRSRFCGCAEGSSRVKSDYMLFLA